MSDLGPPWPSCSEVSGLYNFVKLTSLSQFLQAWHCFQQNSCPRTFLHAGFLQPMTKKNSMQKCSEALLVKKIQKLCLQKEVKEELVHSF